MIALIVGPPGSGKSYTSVALIAEALRNGKPVATNIELSEDWPERVAATYPLAPFRRRGGGARKGGQVAPPGPRGAPPEAPAPRPPGPHQRRPRGPVPRPPRPLPQVQRVQALAAVP